MTKNRADADGGGISASCHGGIGSVSIRNSTVSGNRADANGDGIGRGGGIYLQTTTGIQSEILRSTFANNRSGSEGGGAYTDLGRMRIEASTFNGNISRLGGGGISVDGTEPLIVLNTTVAGNKSASNGGGIYADGSSVVRLNSVTVVRNRGNTDGMFSEAGGGLFSDVPAGDFVVRNSIVSSNAVTDLVPGNPPVKSDCANIDGRPFLSLGHNLLTTRFACDGFTKTGDRVRANPKIGNLGKHGGPTATIPLLKGSPALNRADGSAPKRDQRGVQRSDPDIGAYERRPSARLLVAVDDPAAREVVRAELELHAVAREDLDPVAAHLPGGVAERVVPVVERDLEHPVREGLDDLAFQLELFFLGGYSVTSFPGGE